jgi:hypothetical protein
MTPCPAALVIRRHRAAEICSALHRRQAELHRPPAARRDDALEAQAQRCRIPPEGELQSHPGQRLCFAVEQQLGGLGRLVAGAQRTAVGIARAARDEPAILVPARLFLPRLFLPPPVLARNLQALTLPSR